MCVSTLSFVRRERALEQRTHQHDASARAVVLVLEREVRRARLQAEAAVHARVDARDLVRERTAGNRASASARRVGALTRAAPRIPGFSTPSGSNVRLDTRGESRSPRAAKASCPTARRAVARRCAILSERAAVDDASIARVLIAVARVGTTQRTTPRSSVACVIAPARARRRAIASVHTRSSSTGRRDEPKHDRPAAAPASRRRAHTLGVDLTRVAELGDAIARCADERARCRRAARAASSRPLETEPRGQRRRSRSRSETARTELARSQRQAALQNASARRLQPTMASVRRPPAARAGAR